MLARRALGLILSALWAGCATATAQAPSAAKEPSARAKDYYPLAPGSVWVYKANYLGQAQERTVVMGPKQDGYYVDDAGGKLLYDGVGLRDDRRYLLREPIEVGQSWHSVAALGATETYTIVKAGAPCETPAGRFDDCVEVKSTMAAEDTSGGPGGTLEATMVFAKATGLVRLHTVLSAGDKRTSQVEMELLEYRPAAP